MLSASFHGKCNEIIELMLEENKTFYLAIGH